MTDSVAVKARSERRDARSSRSGNQLSSVDKFQESIGTRDSTNIEVGYHKTSASKNSLF